MYWLDDVSFIAHPNTGSRSLKKFINTTKGAKTINDQHGICLDTIKESRAVTCVIRNPYDLLASFYWRMKSKPDFHKWLHNTLRQEIGHEDPDQVGGGMFYGLPYATHVIRFETLQEDYDRVFKQLRLPPMKLERIGACRYRTSEDYRDLYDYESMALVKAKYGDLMSRLRYKF